jgi:hypothetical protein
MNVRRKGKEFELRIAKKLGKALGTEPKRSSYYGKYWDDNGIDLMPEETAPFLIQCKAVETCKYLHDTLANMYQDRSKYGVVVHKLNRRPPVAILTLDDFLEIVEMLKANKLI